MAAKNKLFKGFLKKPSPPRTQDEIDRDYTQNAVQYAHKARCVLQLQKDIDQYQAEMEKHLARMIEINQEAMAFAKAQEAAKAAASTPTPPVTEGSGAK